MLRPNTAWLLGVFYFVSFGCSGNKGSPTLESHGGSPNEGGMAGTVAPGGASQGSTDRGGSPSSGGATTTGSPPSAGGVPPFGGSPSNGGTGLGSGGTPTSGGSATSGGKATNGAGGATTGGKASGGAAAGTATGGVVSNCAVPVPIACTSAPTVKITEIDVGATVLANEDDAALKILSISPIPSGGSRVAWMGNNSQVHITTLDCNDAVVSSFALPAMDYGDIYADNAGGVLLVARNAQGGGTLNCGAPTNLCGTPPSPAVPCYDEYMVRFDGTSETWATKLTTSSATLPPYSTGPTGASVYFIWWYAHHGRLAFDGTNYAGYYGAATSISQACTTGGNTAINIHQGDEMRVVSPSGSLLTGHNSFDWGCSHSGFEKILWDPAASRFVMICRSDTYPHVGLNVNAANLVGAIDAANSAVSNLVLAAGGGYWVLVSNVGSLHLFKFTTGASTADVNLGNGNKPHLVTYGDHLLASWVPGTTGNMVGQILDAATGAAIGTTFPIAVPSNQFHDFRNYSDGTAAYVAPGSSTTKLKIVRVMPCQ